MDDRTTTPPNGHAPLPDHLETVQRRLRWARETRRLSQEDAAAALGRSRTILHAIESGKRTPTDAELSELARIYDVPVDWIIGRPPRPVAIDGSAPSRMTVVDALIEGLRRIPVGGDPEAGARVIRQWTSPAGDALSVQPGQILVDLDLFDAILAAQSIDELRHIAPRAPKGSPYMPQISFGVTPRTVVVTYAEALGRQSEVDEHVERLVLQAERASAAVSPQD